MLTGSDIIKEKISHLDTDNMYQVLKNFPLQVRDAISSAEQQLAEFPNFNYDKVVISGMGGSAIAGDLIRSYLNSICEYQMPIFVNRNYNIPAFVNETTLFIASSYSGNTEETITALQKAVLRTKQILCICSGGELYDFAKENKLFTITIPSGYQPRLAIGYLFFPVLLALFKPLSQSFKIALEESIKMLLEELETQSESLSNYRRDKNLAVNLAKKLHNNIPIIFSDCEFLDSVNLRWRSQIQENAKQLCFGNFLPEMNHNEINAFNFPEHISKSIGVIILLDELYPRRTKVRCEALRKILEESPQISFTDIISSNAPTFLCRMFEIIYLGDWVSYYLALLNNVAPTPIPVISKLKNYLWEHREL